MLKRQLLVVDAEQVEQRSLEIVDVYSVFGNVVAEVIGFTVDRSGFDATSGHPHAEAAGVMIATVVVLGQSDLAI